MSKLTMPALLPAMLTIAALIMALSPTGSPVRAQSLPHVFIGTATIDGEPAYNGTVVSALVDGKTVTRTNVVNGKYTLPVVPPAGSSFGGKTVVFALRGYPADQVAFWEWGQASLLDLTASTTPPVVKLALAESPPTSVQRGEKLPLIIKGDLGQMKIAGAVVSVDFDPQVFEVLYDASAPGPADRESGVKLDEGTYTSGWQYRSPTGGSPASGELDSLVLQVKESASSGFSRVSIQAGITGVNGVALQTDPKKLTFNLRIFGVAGDLNDDDLVDFVDLATLGSVWGSQKGQPDFNSLYDLDGDGVIGEGDLELLNAHYSSAKQ